MLLKGEHRSVHRAVLRGLRALAVAHNLWVTSAQSGDDLHRRMKLKNEVKKKLLNDNIYNKKFTWKTVYQLAKEDDWKGLQTSRRPRMGRLHTERSSLERRSRPKADVECRCCKAKPASAAVNIIKFRSLSHWFSQVNEGSPPGELSEEIWCQ